LNGIGINAKLNSNHFRINSYNPWLDQKIQEYYFDQNERRAYCRYCGISVESDPSLPSFEKTLRFFDEFVCETCASEEILIKIDPI